MPSCPHRWQSFPEYSYTDLLKALLPQSLIASLFETLKPSSHCALSVQLDNDYVQSNQGLYIGHLRYGLRRDMCVLKRTSHESRLSTCLGYSLIFGRLLYSIILTFSSTILLSSIIYHLSDHLPSIIHHSSLHPVDSCLWICVICHR